MKPCANCGAYGYARIQWDGMAMQWRYVCTVCGRTAPGADTPEQARDEWEKEGDNQ